ncbi:DoxX family protein [Ancylobacter sp. Lp-2]|uniref:DoxX family protein n=1 Tax=Ancylobacter sp. Lp-2 TaxID=2881339 RepID=UPI001E2D41D3|nr:DoxX family protein [Ancylobacter sp. Lp-2]MCB4768321.1 DoxX family protein [Ancylobacter sp. Lp-2]
MLTYWRSRAAEIGAWLLAGFFILGSFGNAFASDAIISDYVRWGYPAYFRFVTATLELAAAVLIMRRATRLAGLALGAAVMAAALGTVLLHGEYTHALAPLVVLMLLTAVATPAIRRVRSAQPVR